MNAPRPALCESVCTMWRNGRCAADLPAELCKHRPPGSCPVGAETARKWAEEKNHGDR